MATLAKRDPSIDLMRFIGLSMIVLAHIGLSRTDSVLFQLRSFDVPLMVFTSGLAFSGKKTGPYLPFIWKRTLRLIVPVYLFVTAYMLLNPVLSQWGLVENYTWEQVMGTYGLRLNPSIGYVWVIRVFLIVMLLTPVLLWLEERMKRHSVFYLTVAAMLGLQWLLVWWLKPLKLGVFVNDWLLYIFGYSAVFMTGLRFRKAFGKERLVIFGIVLAVMAAMAIYITSEQGTWIYFQKLKYPPRPYFLMWGILVSMFLWMTSGMWSKLLDNSLFTFIGRNTIWIYLWHIPFVNLVADSKTFDALYMHWNPVWKYIFVYGCALAVYGIQYWLVQSVESRWPKNIVTKYFKG